MKLIEILRKFVALKGDQRWLLAEAVTVMFTTKFLLLILPVRTVMNISLSGKNKGGESDQKTLDMIKWALDHAGRLSFWKNRCLVQSLSGRWMLQRRRIDSQIFFGVRHDNKKRLSAHAWLKTNDFEVVEKGDDYRELFSF